ncbi:MAG: hypothetical protein ACXWFB_07710 [Nitrososphaeraceae archaeon]
MLIEDIGLRLKDNNYILELQKDITNIKMIVILSTNLVGRTCQ